MAHLLFIGVGGFAGAVTRYLVDGRLQDLAGTAFPWGTLTVNLVGSLLVGFLFALIVERAALASELRGPLMIGFIGSFTTFSTWALESWRMVEDGAWAYAGLNLVGSVLLGLVAVIIGITVGRAI